MIQFENAIERFNKVILSELREEAKVNCWLAGGCLRDYFSGTPAKTDFDLFFPNEFEYQKAASYFKGSDADIIWESDNGMKVKYNKKTFDLVKKFFDSPTDTINAFDFTVSMFATDGKKIFHGESSFIDLSKRQLMFNAIPYPASSMKRAFKYYQKGFSMCVGEMKKLVEAINAMEIEPPKEVSEQSDEQERELSGNGMDIFIGID